MTATLRSDDKAKQTMPYEWSIVSGEQIAGLTGKVMLRDGCLLAQLKRETAATLPPISWQ